MNIVQNTYALRPTVQAWFLGTGGTEPYFYEVLPGGAGGSIHPSTGRYTAPAAASSNPLQFFDSIRVTDYVGATATAQILVGGPLQLVMEILQRVMAIPDGRVYLYNQKIMQPTDSGLYIAVRLEDADAFGQSKPFASTEAGIDQSDSVSMIETISFELISRSTEALNRRAEFMRVWNSNYAQAQQNLNSFLIGRDPVRPFRMIPDLDGAAIPYRFRASYHLQYAEKLTAPVAFYDDFSDLEIEVNP